MAKRKSKNSTAAFRDRAHRGYLIRQSPINEAIWIEKDGFLIQHVKSASEGEKVIDSLLSNPRKRKRESADYERGYSYGRDGYRQPGNAEFLRGQAAGIARRREVQAKRKKNPRHNTAKTEIANWRTKGYLARLVKKNSEEHDYMHRQGWVTATHHGADALMVKPLAKKNPRGRMAQGGTAKLGKWEVTIKPGGTYGYFEHDDEGEGGGLWIENGALVDFDGRSVLPLNVARILRDHFHIAVESMALADEAAWEKETPGSGAWRNNPRKRRVKKNPADAWVIAFYTDSGRRYSYDANRNRFTDNSKPALYRSEIAAQEKASTLVRKYEALRKEGSKIMIEPATPKESGDVFGARPRQRNPKARAPKVGDTITSDRLGDVVIVAVHPLGTYDVKAKSGKYYRMSGLPLANPRKIKRPKT